MLSQGDQLLQQLRSYDQLKSQSSNIAIPPTTIPNDGSSVDQDQPTSINDQYKTDQTHSSSPQDDTPALGRYKLSDLMVNEPDTIQKLHSNTREEQYTSLKILNNRPKYVPPINFALVEHGIYRSGHPQPINYQYLRDLNIKTIIYIGDKEDNYEYYKFILQENIHFKYLKLETSVAPLIYTNPECLTELLNIIVNVENYPILIHSNKGKHRVGILVGLIRKFLQGWCLSGIFDEYDKFAGGKGDTDLELIETYNCSLTIDDSKKPGFVRL